MLSVPFSCLFWKIIILKFLFIELLHLKIFLHQNASFAHKANFIVDMLKFRCKTVDIKIETTQVTTFLFQILMFKFVVTWVVSSSLYKQTVVLFSLDF
jgi:hypothetical protein